MTLRSRKEILGLLAKAIDKIPPRISPELKELVQDSSIPLYVEMHHAYREATVSGARYINDPAGEGHPIFSYHMGYVAELQVVLERMFPEEPIYSGTDPYLLGAWKERAALRSELIIHIERARATSYADAKLLHGSTDS
jgi:hypothetical protein